MKGILTSFALVRAALMPAEAQRATHPLNVLGEVTADGFAVNTVLRLASVLCALIILAGPATAQPAPPSSEGTAPASQDGLDAVLACVLRGRQADWTTDRWQCGDYFSGSRPFQHEATAARPEWRVQWERASAACRDGNSRARLPRDLIDRILDHPSYRTSPKPIRVFGGVFCDGIQAIGVRVPAMVVLDWSVVFRDVAVRNADVAGDLTIDNAILMDDVVISRSIVGGILSLRRSDFLAPVTIEDISLGAWLSLGRASFLDAVAIDRVRTEGLIEISEANLGFLLLRHNSVGGRLAAETTGFRCAAHITKNSFGDVILSGSGFNWTYSGTTRGWDTAERQGRPSLAQTAALASHSDWRSSTGAAARRMARTKLVERRLNCDFGGSLTAPDAQPRSRTYVATIQFHDNVVGTNLCIRDIRWPAPQPGVRSPDNTDIAKCRASERVRAVVSFRNSSVGSMVIFNPILTPRQLTPEGRLTRMPPQTTGHPKDVCSHLITAHSISMRSLVVDLAEPPDLSKVGAVPFHLDIDGLTFDRVHNADITCFFSNEARPTIGDGGQIARQVFGAFADALQKSGASAAALRIERNRQDTDRAHAAMTTSGLWTFLSGNSSLEGTFISNLQAYLANRAWALHGALTNFGHNPEYVLLPALILILVVWLVQISVFRIWAAEVDSASRYITIGPLFILDRFVPLYKIREEHAKIKRYLTRKPIGSELVDPLVISPQTTQYFERMLVGLKIVGVFAAIFLAAAVGSLVAK
jgi:hypothetical protein